MEGSHRRKYASAWPMRSPQTQRARELRENATPAEKLLWSALRGKQLKGRKFRRQCPLGSYFADFACLSERLIVEIDGAQHDAANIAQYDGRRTLWLGRQNYRVLRFRNEEVLGDLPMVIATIRRALENPRFS